MKKVYITGTSGTGKSAIATELNRRGFYAIDIDSDEYGLCQWKNKETKESSNFENNAGTDFLNKNGWYCDIDRLGKLINEAGKDIFIVGIANNQSEYFKLFDKIFLLQCDEKILIERINNRTENDFGKHPSERNYILGYYKEFENDLIKRGAIPIDTNNSIDFVINDILLKCDLL